MPTAGSPSCFAVPTLFDLAARSLTHADAFAFALSQDQQAILGHIHRLLIEQGDGQRVAVVVAGTAGSGKSALALTLLGEAVRAGYRARHATGSQAFTTALRKAAGHGSRARQQLFQYFGTAADTERELDLLVCDDAHQRRATSNTRYTPGTRRSDRTQTEQLLDTARVVVFLLDEDQAIRPGQVGTRDYIETTARLRRRRAHGPAGEPAPPPQHALRQLGPPPAQPRWRTGAVDLLERRGEPGYAVRAAGGRQLRRDGAAAAHEDRAGGERPDDRRAVLALERGQAGTSAGRRHRDRRLASPVDRAGPARVHGLPPSPLWALDPAGAGQVGGIYSAQGFEYDYGGVILGPDLLWRGDRWITDSAATRDDALDRAPAADLDLWVRRTYRVLLTRARAGTVLCSTDAETRALLHGIIDA